MKALLAAAFVAVVLTGCSERRRPPAPEAAQPVARYLALGDSFTSGTGSSPAQAFPSRLAERWNALRCPVELRNLGVDGYTTDDVIAEELPAVPAFHPTFVTVGIGANDIVQGHSLASYRSNVRRILGAASANGARVVVLPQPAWSHSPSAAAFGTVDQLDATIATFNAALKDEALAAGAQWVELWPLMQAQARSGLLAGDGLHPSSTAHDAWAAELARVVPSPCGDGG